MKWEGFNITELVDSLRALFMKQEYEFTKPEFVIVDDQDPSVAILEIILSEVDSNKFSKGLANEVVENYLENKTKVFTKITNESI